MAFTNDQLAAVHTSSLSLVIQICGRDPVLVPTVRRFLPNSFVPLPHPLLGRLRGRHLHERSGLQGYKFGPLLDEIQSAGYIGCAHHVLCDGRLWIHSYVLVGIFEYHRTRSVTVRIQTTILFTNENNTYSDVHTCF